MTSIRDNLRRRFPDLPDGILDAIISLDAATTADTIEALSPWLQHRTGCVPTSCICGLDRVLTSLRASATETESPR